MWKQEEAKNELLALLQEEITRDTNEVNAILMQCSLQFSKKYFSICVRQVESSTQIERATKMVAKLWLSRVIYWQISFQCEITRSGK